MIRGVDMDGNVDLTEVDTALADVDVRSKRMAPAFRELRAPMRRDQAAHAKQQEGPNGAWPPRSPLTEARRRARNRRRRVTKAMITIGIASNKKKRSTPKRILGRLPRAVVYTIGDLFLRATSRVPWSGAHQDGGRVGRGVKLPARPFLWLSDVLINATKDVLGKYVLKGWNR